MLWSYHVHAALINHFCGQVNGAVFDLPEEVATELLNQPLPPGNTITKITKVCFDLFITVSHSNNLCIVHYN